MSPPAICCGTRRRASATRRRPSPDARTSGPLRSATRLQLLAEETAHLRASVARRNVVDVVVCRQNSRIELEIRRRGTSRRSAAARSTRTESRSERRTSGPCRRNSTAQYGAHCTDCVLDGIRHAASRTEFAGARTPGSGTLPLVAEAQRGIQLGCAEERIRGSQPARMPSRHFDSGLRAPVR